MVAANAAITSMSAKIQALGSLLILTIIPHESAYYRLTGTIAYNSLENGKEYGTKHELQKRLWKNGEPNTRTPKTISRTLWH